MNRTSHRHESSNVASRIKATASGWASALRVTPLPAICVTQSFGDDIDVLDTMRFVNAEGIHTEGSRPAARRSLDDRRHIEPHAMIRADVLCDSSVSFRVIRGSTMRFNRRVQRSNSQTRPPPNQGMTKSAIHPSRWLSATLNANDCHQRMAGTKYRCQNANYRHSAAWLCSGISSCSCSASRCSCS